MSEPEPIPGENPETELPLSMKLEILFVAPEPVTTAQLAAALM
jgi:hypothetical protein